MTDKDDTKITQLQKDDLIKARSNIALVMRMMDTMSSDYNSWHDNHNGMSEDEKKILNQSLHLIDAATGTIPSYVKNAEKTAVKDGLNEFC